MQSWIDKVGAAGELANDLTRTVPKALAEPTLTLDQATRLFQIVERHTKIVERLVSDLQDADVDESLLDAADALDDIMAELAEACANRMIKLRQAR